LPDINIFVPPWNAWNSDTAEVLKKVGFSILSADRDHYYESVRGLRVIPYTALLSELEMIVNQDRLPQDGIVVVVYHPEDIFRFPGEAANYYFGVERLEKLLQKLLRLEGVEVGTFAHLLETHDDITIERYKQANNLWRQRSFWAKLLPRDLWPGAKDQGVYLLAEEYSRQVRNWRLASAGLIGGLLVFGLMIRHLLVSLLSARWCLRIDILVTLFFCLSIIAELRLLQRGYHVTAIRSIPVFFGVGFVMRLVLQILRRKNVLRRRA